MTYISKSFIKPLAASGLTSILMILDRVVMNFIPLLFWGVEQAAFWIFLRAWLFVLMSFEGGIGGKTANQISKTDITIPTDDVVVKIVKNRLFQQIYWGLTILIANAVVVWSVSYYQIFQFPKTSEFIFTLIGLYSAFYYLTQLVVYCHRGIGRIYQGQMFANSTKLIEVLALTTLPALNLGVLECVISLIIIRGLSSIIGFLILFRKLGKTKKENIIQKKQETTKDKKSITLGFILYPLFPALNNFLPIFFLSSVLSPILIMQFSISRLFGRILLQLSQILSRVLWPFLNLKNDSLDFINSFKQIISTYIKISGGALILIVTSAIFLNNVEFKEVKLDSTILIIYSVLAFFMGLVEVYLSMLIAKERHTQILLIRIILCILTPLYVLIANSDTSLEILGMIMLIAELITLVMCLWEWLKIVKENGGSQLYDKA